MRFFNGHALIAAVFRELDPAFRQTLLLKLRASSPILARFVERSYFIFDDIVRLDSRSIDFVLRHFSEQEWMNAWKLASEEVREVLLGAMSERRREDFLSQQVKQKKVPRRQVVLLQGRMARDIQALLETGKIAMKSKGLIERQRLRKKAKRPAKGGK